MPTETGTIMAVDRETGEVYIGRPGYGLYRFKVEEERCYFPLEGIRDDRQREEAENSEVG